MNQLKTITRALVIFCLLLGAAVAYRSCSKKEIKAEVQASSSSTKKKKTKRVIPQAGGLAPIIEETEEDEKLDQFVKASLSVPAAKKYLMGLTLGYDFERSRVTYNLMAGKAISEDCFAIGKTSTDFQLSKVEAGILCTR